MRAATGGFSVVVGHAPWWPSYLYVFVDVYGDDRDCNPTPNGAGFVHLSWQPAPAPLRKDPVQ